MQGRLVGQPSRMTFGWQDSALCIEKTKKGRAPDVGRTARRIAGMFQNPFELRQSIPVHVVDLSLFQRGTDSDGAGKCATFFRDGFRLGLLNLQEGLDLILELRVESPLLIRSPILLGEINGPERHAQDDDHHPQEQLRAEAERRRKIVVEGNGLVTWLENRHATSCRLSIPQDVAGRRRQPPKLSAGSSRREDVPGDIGPLYLFFENAASREREWCPAFSREFHNEW